MKLKAIKSFSSPHVGNITSGQTFPCESDDVISFLVKEKLVEPVGDFAYQNKMLKLDVKKKGHRMDSIGSESGKDKPSSASPAVPASATDKLKPSGNGESKTEGESSSPTPPTETSRSATSSTDATTAGGNTSRKAAKKPRGRTSRKQQTPKAGRRTKAPRKDSD